MIKKTKHPSNKAERRAIELTKSQLKIRKKLHKGASPVAKLLNEKEIKDAAERTKDVGASE